MEKIFLIGDVHTVNAFRICGIEGAIADSGNSDSVLKSLLSDEEFPVILVTRDCAGPVSDMIKKINLESGRKVIIEIPGIDDTAGFSKSLTSYITEALGVAL